MGDVFIHHISYITHIYNIHSEPLIAYVNSMVNNSFPYKGFSEITDFVLFYWYNITLNDGEYRDLPRCGVYNYITIE